MRHSEQSEAKSRSLSGITSRKATPGMLLLLLLLLAIGCTDSYIIPIAGYWTGEFKAQPAEAGQQMKKEWAYKGYLQLYATGMKYKMHMESVAQIVDISGTWKKKKDKIYLTAGQIDFDDKGGDLQRPLGVTPISPDLVRQAYSQEMVLKYEPSKSELDGLEMSMGPLIGHHVFTKGGE